MSYLLDDTIEQIKDDMVVQIKEDMIMDMSVEVCKSFDEVSISSTEWDDFVEDVCGDIFMTYDWCRVWWKYYGENRNLRLFIFRSDDELVGIVPLFFEKIWLGPVFVRAVKIVGSDFTLSQFSLPIRDNFFKEVTDELSNKLHVLKWDIIHIGPIAGRYNSFVELKECLRLSFNSCAEVESSEKGVQTYFDLAENWEDHLSTLSKRERGDVRRNYRYIAKIFDDTDKPIQTIAADSNNIEEMFGAFATMHKAHWNMLNKAGHFGDWPGSFDFHYEMSRIQLKRDRLRLFKIVDGGVCLGYEYDYKCGQNYFEILNARIRDDRFKNISLGKIAFSEQAKKAIDEKVSSIDSMRGKYDHKIKMGGKLYPIHSVYVVRRGYFREIKVRLFRLLSRLFNICYYKIWFSRIAPKVLKKRKHLSRLWMRTHFFS